MLSPTRAGPSTTKAVQEEDPWEAGHAAVATTPEGMFWKERFLAERTRAGIQRETDREDFEKLLKAIRESHNAARGFALELIDFVKFMLEDSDSDDELVFGGQSCSNDDDETPQPESKNYQVYLLIDLARLTCYVGKCWGGQGVKLRVWKEIGTAQNFEAIREDATYDELSSFSTEHRNQVLRRWGGHCEVLHSVKTPFEGWSRRLHFLILHSGRGSAKECDEAEARAIKAPFFPLFAGKSYTYFLSSGLSARGRGKSPAVWEPFVGPVVRRNVILMSMNNRGRSLPSESGIKKQAGICVGCCAVMANRQPNQFGRDGLLMACHRVSKQHKMDRACLSIRPRLNALTEDRPPSCWQSPQEWREDAHAAFSDFLHHCKEFSPDIESQTVSIMFVRHWCDQHLFRLALRASDLPAAEIDWTDLPAALIVEFAAVQKAAGL